ncbi:hypothetical protein [Kitasatospora sp. NPDC015120]|uniref:hypothetical protein n=1 Tax=Kitasatospora sp. NPDC015120 TaxID=3364023 RepID=UPI0036F4629D
MASEVLEHVVAAPASHTPQGHEEAGQQGELPKVDGDSGEEADVGSGFGAAQETVDHEGLVLPVIDWCSFMTSRREFVASGHFAGL